MWHVKYNEISFVLCRSFLLTITEMFLSKMKEEDSSSASENLLCIMPPVKSLL